MTKRVAKNEFEGTCQACFHSQVLTGSKQTLVLHGYQRPGDGFLRGDCEGHGHLPYELSSNLTSDLLARADKRLVSEKTRLESLVANKVDSLVIEVPNPEYSYYVSARMSVPKTKFITIGRDYTGTDNRNFEHHRKVAIVRAEADIKSTEYTIKFYGQKVADWKYAPEALRNHAQVVREEKQAKAQTKADKKFASDWKHAWLMVARGIDEHKYRSNWLAETLASTCSADIKERVQTGFNQDFGHLPAFPDAKARAAARKNFKK